MNETMRKADKERNQAVMSQVKSAERRRRRNCRCLLGAVIAATTLAGCKYFPSFDEVLPDKKSEYKKSESLPDLDVPPDLSSEAIKDTMAVPEIDQGTATYSTYQERQAARHKGTVAPNDAAADTGTRSPSAPAANEGTVSVRGTPEEIWPKLRNFWRDNGYTVAMDDLRSGRMTTEWVENERQMTREKFELRALPGTSGTTSLTLQHVAQAQKPEGERLTWADVPASSPLSSWLTKIEGAVGGAPVSMVSPEEREAQRAERDREAKSTGDSEQIAPEILYAGEGKKYLLIGLSFAEAWKNTGEALTKAGIEVEDKDESRGVYYVRYNAEDTVKRGFFSRLAFWRGASSDAKHQVSITAVGRKAEVVVLDHKGNWENNQTADRILESIQGQLKQRR